MIHLNGRHPIAKMGYTEVGKQIGKNLGYIDIHTCKGGDDFKWLDTAGYPEITELLPQRTVVQFNSTYMELIGRHDRVKGTATAWMIFFVGGIGYAIYNFIIGIQLATAKNETLMLIYISFLLFIMLVLMVSVAAILLTEVFTFTYFPIRFNRKTRKVYVRQANRKVQVFDWNELRFYMSTSKPAHDGADIKALTVTKDGVTVDKMFAFPFVSETTANEYIGGIQLKQHFEFVRCYMDAENEEQLEEVKNAIRYIHPVHQKRETPLVSFQRVVLGGHDTYANMEYPKTSFNPDVSLLAISPILWMRYLGRLLSINTSITPRFSAAIEAECQINLNDPHDLNKNLPEGSIEDSNQSIWKTVAYSVAFILFSIIMLFAFAFFVDMIGGIKGQDSVLVSKLLNLFSLKWLS